MPATSPASLTAWPSGPASSHTLGVIGVISKKYDDHVQLLAGLLNADPQDLHHKVCWKGHFADTGFYVYNLNDLAEMSVGPMIFMSLAVSFTTEAFKAFFGILMFIAFSAGGKTFNLFMFLFCLFFAILTCLFLFIHVVIIFKSQEITDTIKRTRKALETIVFRQEAKLNTADVTKH
jgi:hypothetical protein